MVLISEPRLIRKFEDGSCRFQKLFRVNRTHFPILPLEIIFDVVFVCIIRIFANHDILFSGEQKVWAILVSIDASSRAGGFAVLVIMTPWLTTTPIGYLKENREISGKKEDMHKEVHD